MSGGTNGIVRIVWAHIWIMAGVHVVCGVLGFEPPCLGSWVWILYPLRWMNIGVGSRGFDWRRAFSLKPGLGLGTCPQLHPSHPSHTTQRFFTEWQQDICYISNMSKSSSLWKKPNIKNARMNSYLESTYWDLAMRETQEKYYCKTAFAFVKILARKGTRYAWARVVSPQKDAEIRAEIRMAKRSN